MIHLCGLLVIVLLLVLHRFAEPATGTAKRASARPPQKATTLGEACRLREAAVLANLATRGLQLAKGG